MASCIDSEQTAPGHFETQAKSIRIWDIIPFADTLATVKGISDDSQEKLQNLLRVIRVDAGITQAELAGRLGVPQSVISKYESGERRLDVLELRQVCKSLGLGFADFVRRLEREVP